MKIFKKIFSSLAVLAMALAPVAVINNTNAVTTNPTSVTITRYINNVTNPVNNTFTYTVEEDGDNPETNLTGLPSSFTIAFSNKAPNAGTTTAEETGTLNLGSINFTKVGDYKFKITETASSNTDNVYPLDTDYWYAYISVRYITDNNPTEVSGTPTSNVKAVTATVGTENTKDPINPNPSATPAILGNKDNIHFESAPEFTYIELSKKVTGNLGDITEYFEYTINLGSAMASTATITKSVTILDRDGNGFSTDGTNAATSPATVDTDTSGNIKVYLKHNQAVQIGLTAALPQGKAQIPLKVNATTNTPYTVAETIKPASTFSPKKAYTIYIDGSTTASSNGIASKTMAAIPADPSNTTAADTIAFNTNNKTAYVNNKEADPISGFFVNYWPFMLLVILGIIGVIIFKKTSKQVNK